MGIKCQRKFSFSSLTYFPSPNPTEFFPLHVEQNQPTPMQQDSPVPSLPCKQTPQQPAPGLSGTQWLEDLFCSKQPKITLLVSAFKSSELTLTPFLEPSQSDEPLILPWRSLPFHLGAQLPPPLTLTMRLGRNLWICD
ncbi:hypothetical protein O181_069506 [Austropuccinia psidii MF-1]|uniref:Uncharacterized protein n=1 Tax=Austropuccinia psidii MF-1 TaxID=1389203 RepID=A0A9Q3F3M5_9BASI|nr:hypothetical protein [Austropuccinia psidii MF-1]